MCMTIHWEETKFDTVIIGVSGEKEPVFVYFTCYHKCSVMW